MSYQATFKRHEIKYLLTKEQKGYILQAMSPFMLLDSYGRTTIRNIYLDTENYRLIRRSAEKPVYKEKIRIRSYRLAKPEDNVFIELKKKYSSVVYKRRISAPESYTMSGFLSGEPLPHRSQIAREIEYFRDYYSPLRPSVFLSYEREAYYDLCGSDLRITLDENVLYRDCDISLQSDTYGIPLTGCGTTLMEIKSSGGIPLWLSRALCENHIYITSFSKYGAAYNHILANSKIQNENTRRLYV